MGKTYKDGRFHEKYQPDYEKKRRKGVFKHRKLIENETTEPTDDPHIMDVDECGRW